MKTVEILFSFILCIAGFFLLDIAFPEMDTRQSIALAFAIICFFWYQRIQEYIYNNKD